MPRPKKPLKKPKDRNRHPTTGIVLGSFLRNLPLFESDFYFGMQATNLEIVDGILRDMEAQLLADYMEEERTPMPSSLVVSALSQLWIFGLYELLRTWRSRADLILTFADTLANADRLEQLRLIEKQKEKIEKLAEPSDGLVFRWPPFERVAKDPAYAAQLQSVCDNMELLFRRLEALRMTLAKHELPKSQAYAMAPGYGRIHMLTGSIYWQVLLGEDEVDIVSRRELADECDHLLIDRSRYILPKPLQAKVKTFPKLSYSMRQIAVKLRNGKEYRRVLVFWNKLIVRVLGRKTVPFDARDVVSVEHDPDAAASPQASAEPRKC